MDDLRLIWQGQEVGKGKCSAEEVRATVAELKRRIRRRTLLGHAIALSVIVWFGIVFLETHSSVERIASTLIIAGTICLVWLKHRGVLQPVPADMGRADCIAFVRSGVERQRNLMGSVWKWGLGPMNVGIALFAIHGIIVLPPAGLWISIGLLCGQGAIIWRTVWLNRRVARRVDLWLAELDRELRNT